MEGKKNIAVILETQKIFITYNGDYYSYVEEQGCFHCRKMNVADKKAFFNDYRRTAVDMQAEMVAWQMVSHGDKFNKKIEQEKSVIKIGPKTILLKNEGRLMGLFET